MMTQADCLIKAVIACLEARFQEDRGNTERGIPDGFPVPLKMAVDEDREGKEYALFQAAEMEEIVAGYCTYHAGISVELHLDANDRTADEIRMLQAWMEERLKEVDRAGLNAVESPLPYRNFLVIGKVRLGPAQDAAAEEGAFAVTWKMTVPVQF